jgi:glycosyltransferase involved in cell wall biosynthesis
MIKNILIFSDYFYPGSGGAGPAKSICNFINDNKGFLNCHVITRSWDINKKKYTEKQLISAIKNFFFNCIYVNNYFNYLIFVFIIFKRNYNSIIFLNSFFSFYFTFIPLILNKIFFGRKKIFLAPRGELFTDLINKKYFIKRFYILIFKLLKLDNNLIFTASNNFEYEAIEKIFCKNNIIILSDGFDITNYTYNTNKIKIKNELKLIFISRINVKKNLLFAVKLLRNINANIKFDIYGLNEDPSYLDACLKITNNSSGTVTFNYLGELSPNDVPEKLAKYDLMILPTLGENFGHVISESLLSNTPVLISDKTPWLSDTNCVVTSISLDLISKWNEQILFFLNLDNCSYHNILRNIKSYLIAYNNKNDYDPFIIP